jgi:AraC-like DNA-binding protein
MSISFSQLCFAEPSPEARRLLWYVLSIGSVSRDEPERHDGLDKAGLFLFRVVAGTGRLELRGNQHRLTGGQDCWLVDLRHPRIYLPDDGKTLRTEGVRFSGPGAEAWLELLGTHPVFTLPPGTLRLRLGRLRHLVQRRPPQYEWAVHSELTDLWGGLLAARGVFIMPKTTVPPPVARVLDAVFADPARNWRARDLAVVAGVSYSRLRDHFQSARGETLHQFLQRTRLDLARRLLGDQRLAIKEVARRLNFSSEFHFSRFFHRGSGMSPTQFRERSRA